MTIASFPIAWGGKVNIGDVSGPLGEWLTFDGYLKDFKFYNQAITD